MGVIYAGRFGQNISSSLIRCAGETLRIWDFVGECLRCDAQFDIFATVCSIRATNEAKPLRQDTGLLSPAG